MKYNELKQLAKEHKVDMARETFPHYVLSGDELFQKLIERGVIPYKYRLDDYHNVELGQLGFYSNDDSSVSNKIINQREIDFNSFAIKEFTDDLYKAFENTDYEIDEFHSITGKTVTAIVISKSNPNNKLHLKATMEGWLIVNGKEEN